MSYGLYAESVWGVEVSRLLTPKEPWGLAARVSMRVAVSFSE